MGAKDLGIMSGYYQPTKERLKSIRDKIKSDPKQFQKLYTTKEFVSKYGSIQGEANKRIPPDSKELLPSIVDYWQAAKPLNDFFTM